MDHKERRRPFRMILNVLKSLRRATVSHVGEEPNAHEHHLTEGEMEVGIKGDECCTEERFG